MGPGELFSAEIEPLVKSSVSTSPDYFDKQGGAHKRKIFIHMPQWNGNPHFGQNTSLYGNKMLQIYKQKLQVQNLFYVH